MQSFRQRLWIFWWNFAISRFSQWEKRAKFTYLQASEKTARESLTVSCLHHQASSSIVWYTDARHIPIVTLDWSDTMDSYNTTDIVVRDTRTK